jgi:hypothetical protein
MKKFYKLLIAFVLVGSFSKAQVTVSGGSTATYSNVNAAFAAINAGTHFGAITISVTANTIEGVIGYLPTPLLASGQGPANYTSIVLRPTATATISGDVATGRGVLELDGVDNFIINGDIIGGPIQKDLTISCISPTNSAATAAIRLIGRATLGLGATNNTITNCNINGNTEGNDGISGSTVVNSYGIYAGANALNLTTGGLGDNYDNITISNNEITRAYFGIWIGSTTLNPGDNNLISENKIGSNTAGQTITFGGVHVSTLNTSTITLNEVFKLKTTTSVNSAGIQLAGTSNSITVSRNKVYEIYNLSTGGWGAYGINLIGGNNHLVVNNVVYDVLTVNYSSTSTTFNAFGIRITTGTGHKIYYNSVNLFGQVNQTTPSATSVCSAAFLVTSTAVTGIEVRNNIFNNTQTSTLSAVTIKKFMSVWFPTSYNFFNATINNNGYNILNDADHFVGKIGTTNNVNEAATLGAWQLFSQVNNALNDNNSVPVANAAAPFTSNTNLTIPLNTNYAGESGGVLIPALGTNIDYNANVRPLAGINPNTNPDMGAYEFDGVNGIPNDAGINALISPAANGCYGASENVIVAIKNYGTNSITNIPVTLTIAGPINQTLTGTYTGTIVPTGTFNYTLGTINMSAAGIYTFNAFTTLAGDVTISNDAMSQATRTVIAPSPLPQFVSFTGYTGANLPTPFPLWNEAAGASVPTGTTSSWTSQTALNNATNINARLYLSAIAANEWIVGPKILATANTSISFDAALTLNTINPFTPAIMGSDDKIRVMVSTDCGISYTPIYTVSAANNLGTNFTNFTVPLGAYVGQNIIVAFLAQDGPIDDIEAYYLHLDNINLYNASPTDAGVSSFITPGNACYTNAEPVIVTVNNFGTAPISNFTVNAWVSGAVTQTLVGIYSGTLSVLASGTINLGNVNMTTAGQYSFKGFTSLVGDLNNVNDTNTIIKTALPLGTLPQSVNFNGYTGANLTTVFPDWREGDGALLPNGTTSSWINQANFPITGNTSARVFLSSAANTEWIVGPKVLATSSTQVSFDAGLTLGISSPFTSATMGSDDKVLLMVSTNCGASFAPIFTISATNSLTPAFTNFTVSLAAYSGQEIILGFLATDGPVDDIESYYFHLDNINLFNTSATDGGVSAINSPTLNACLSTTEAIVVTLTNYGSGPISNFSVTANINGPINTTLVANYTGTIAPAATAIFTVGTANMNSAGVYTINAFTSIVTDPNGFNNATVVTATQSPAFGISGNTSICTSGTASLSLIGAAVSYTWSTGSNANAITVTPSVTTTYSAIGTGTNGCQVSAFSTVTVSNPTITGLGAAVCGTTAVGTLTANGFAPVTWYATPTPTNPLATGNTFTATAATTTTYYAQANSTNTSSIATTYSAGNGSNGNMFDVTALNPITINSVDVVISSVAVSTVEVWYRFGSFVGFESSNAGWTSAGTGTVMGAGNGNPVPLNVNLGINIPGGQTYGIYVTSNGGATFGYSNGTAVGNLFSQNSDLSVFEGKGGSYFGVTISTRIWNGNIHYTKQGCSSPIIPVTLTVTPSPAITLVASQTSVCPSNSVSIGATGANTYTWSTGANGALVSVTPTASTVYTVSGETTPGCIGTSSIAITTNSVPVVNVASSASLICAGQPVNLTASGASSYVWNTAATTTVISVTPSVTTSYTVTGTAPNTCSIATVYTQSVSTCTGVDANTTFSNLISIYPNPSNGIITAEFGFNGEKEILITNSVGQLIKVIKTKNSSEVIDLDQYAKGIYYVKIMSNENSSNYRIIIQ